MLRLATLLIVLSVCFIAWAGDCPPPSPIKLHSDEAFDLQVFFDNTPAIATPLQLYAGDKLVHSAIAYQNGRVRLGLLPDGKYRVVIPRKGTLDVRLQPVQYRRREHRVSSQTLRSKGSPVAVVSENPVFRAVGSSALCGRFVGRSSEPRRYLVAMIFQYPITEGFKQWPKCV